MQTNVHLQRTTLCLMLMLTTIKSQFNNQNGNNIEHFYKSYQNPSTRNYWYKYSYNGDGPPPQGHYQRNVPRSDRGNRFEWHSNSNGHYGENGQFEKHQEKRDTVQVPDLVKGNFGFGDGNIGDYITKLLNNNDTNVANGHQVQHFENGVKHTFTYTFNNGETNSGGDQGNNQSPNNQFPNWQTNLPTNIKTNFNIDISSILKTILNNDTNTESGTKSPFNIWFGVKPIVSTSNDNNNNNNNNPTMQNTISDWFKLDFNQADNKPENNGPSGSVGNIPVMVPSVPIIDDSIDNNDLLVEAQQHCGRGAHFEDATETSLRIAHGHIATEMYPWLVAIYQAAPGKQMKFICGASLITRKHAVSAAHCFVARETNRYEFIISNNRILNPNEAEKTLRQAERLVLHPGYNPQVTPANADVAVVVFERPVEFDTFVKPICLWRGDSGIRVIDGEIGRIVGWGADKNLVLADSLPMEINTGVVDYKTCIQQDSTFIDVVGANSFCTGYRNGSGPCMGDSGSGFMLQQNGRWSLRGVVSLTTRLVGCDVDHYIGLTDVAKYITWIQDQL